MKLSKPPFAVLAVALLGSSLGACRGDASSDPQSRATALLERADDAEARRLWAADPGNRNVGLDDRVAWVDAKRPLSISTQREILTRDMRQPGCAAAESTGAIFFRTVVENADQIPIASFHWVAFDQAAAGHQRVRAVAAAARGNLAGFWDAIVADPALEEACVRFRDRRDRCPSTPG